MSMSAFLVAAGVTLGRVVRTCTVRVVVGVLTCTLAQFRWLGILGVVELLELDLHLPAAHVTQWDPAVAVEHEHVSAVREHVRQPALDAAAVHHLQRDQPGPGALEVPQLGQRPGGPRRRDLERVGARDDVVSVERRGDRAGRVPERVGVQAAQGVLRQVDGDPHHRLAARLGDAYRLEVQPCGLDHRGYHLADRIRLLCHRLPPVGSPTCAGARFEPERFDRCAVVVCVKRNEAPGLGTSRRT
jgi:hypothetical protein